MKELNNKEIATISGGIGLNDLKFEKFIDIAAVCALKLGMLAGKVITSSWHAARGVIDGAVWGINGCQ